MTNEEIRDIEISYLLDSGFIENYTKKLMFPSDIDDLYNDYVQEAWLAILEIPVEKIAPLYKKGNHKDDFYELRNYISVVIRNTVRSESSNAYRKLKSNKAREQTKTTTDWKIIAETVADDE